MKYKELDKVIAGRGEVKGYEFSQLRASKRAYVYEVNKGGTLYYEVFKRVLNRRFHTVSYPTSNSFGIWAWTFNDKDKAIEKFNKI